MPHLLTVSGSLRAGSSNATLLEAASRLVPHEVTTEVYAGLAGLPAFNPDIEEAAASLPVSVLELRRAVSRADALLISSPEYAHGIPGALKNALDWLVGDTEAPGKRVGLLSASAVSRFAHPQLLEVLRTMNFDVVGEASVVLDLPRRGLDTSALVADPLLSASIRRALGALLARRT